MAKDDIFTPNFQQKSKTLKLLFEKGVTDEKSLLSLSTMQILQIATNYQEAFIISELQVNSKANKAYHGYLSFKEKNITPEQAQEIGMEFARRVWGQRYQVVVTTHLNTHHLQELLCKG